MDISIPQVRYAWKRRIGPSLTIQNGEKNYVLCICHRREDRSFKFYGHVFPLCARCTGILVGFLLGLLMIIENYPLSIHYRILFMLPLLLDGFSQAFGWRESTNPLRFATGILFGIGFTYAGEIFP